MKHDPAPDAFLVTNPVNRILNTVPAGPFPGPPCPDPGIV